MEKRRRAQKRAQRGRRECSPSKAQEHQRDRVRKARVEGVGRARAVRATKVLRAAAAVSSRVVAFLPWRTVRPLVVSVL